MERESLKDRIKSIVYPIINFIHRQRLKNKKNTLSRGKDNIIN